SAPHGLARKYASLKDRLIKRKLEYAPVPLKWVQMRANSTRSEFFSKSNKMPTVSRNLFFPTEILNALGVRMLTLEIYAALFARNSKRTKKALDAAAYKGFARGKLLFPAPFEGSDLPRPDFGVSTSQPCQQGERIFQDLRVSMILPTVSTRLIRRSA
ncbi:MAG: hypothetical protein V8T87_03775, partial [Victivallales bacterium]